jgi:hypothetical protein
MNTADMNTETLVNQIATVINHSLPLSGHVAEVADLVLLAAERSIMTVEQRRVFYGDLAEVVDHLPL